MGVISGVGYSRVYRSLGTDLVRITGVYLLTKKIYIMRTGFDCIAG